MPATPMLAAPAEQDPLEATLVLHEQADSRKVARPPGGKVVLVDLNQMDRIRDGGCGIAVSTLGKVISSSRGFWPNGEMPTERAQENTVRTSVGVAFQYIRFHVRVSPQAVPAACTFHRISIARTIGRARVCEPE